MDFAYNLQLFKEIFFPRHCAVCDAKIDMGLVCEACRNEYTLNKIKIYGATQTSWRALEASGQPLVAEDYFDRIELLYRYDGAFKASLHSLKFEAAKHLLPLLREEAELALKTKMKTFEHHYDVITCIPTSKERKAQRGFDVPWEIFACLKNLNYTDKILERSKSTAPLYTMAAEERRNELEGCFSIAPGAVVKNKRILLCDDIFTTGSTCCEAARVLLKAGAKSVGVLALCASKDNWD